MHARQAKERGLIDGDYKIEEASPCEIAARAGFGAVNRSGSAYLGSIDAVRAPASACECADGSARTRRWNSGEGSLEQEEEKGGVHGECKERPKERARERRTGRGEGRG
eukprot:6185685-Pleurochrysis_carterae.AAC.3